MEDKKKYKITIEYNGTNYYGWQIQKNGPTIQGEIQKALRKILGENMSIMAAGRTDRGVHAMGQVAHFVSTTKIPSQKLLFGLNSLLPWDISILKIEEVDMDFHATLSAKSKRYVYRILNQPYRSGLLNPYVYWYSFPLDIELMREGARFLIGRHDFSAFQSVNSPRTSTIREIYHLEIQKKTFGVHQIIEISVEADGFLYNMVRAISGTLLEVGRKKWPPEKVEEILKSCDRKQAGPTAPARGLCLEKVFY